MTIQLQDKKTLRHSLRLLRQSIPPIRRQEAALHLFTDLLAQLKPYHNILSFASKPDEIDLWKLNEQLAQEKRLLLPKVAGEFLEIFSVADLQNQLALSPFSILEPIADRCPQIPYTAIDCILVPGLGFDAEKRRIGYGKGHYDRLLKAIKQIAPIVGVGFHEQLVAEQIPVEPHDIPMDRLFFY